MPFLKTKYLLITLCLVIVGFCAHLRADGLPAIPTDISLPTSLRNISAPFPQIRASRSTITSSFDDTRSIFEDNEEASSHKKKVSKALVFSLLLPGAGEYYLGNKNNAALFWVAEGAIWLTFASLQVYGHWEEERYISWAISHAGIITQGKDKDYYQNIGLYDDIQDYNYWTYLFERDQDMLYPETADWFWKWDMPESRYYYRELRHNSEKAYRNSNIVIGVAILNRFLSGINVLRLGQQTESDDKLFSLHLRCHPTDQGKVGIRIILSKAF
ncbi:hypothetical protein JW877_07515 [bacterium]|nr:hypothetical protein [bacterium]